MRPTPFFSANSKRDDFFLSLGTVYLGSKSSYVPIFRFHLQVTSYSICRSLSVLLHLLWSSLPFACAWTRHCSILPDGWLTYHWVYRTHFLYSSLCPYPLGLQQCPSCGNWSSRDGMGTLVFENASFPWLFPRAPPRLIFWRSSVLCFLVDEPMDVFSNPIQTNFLMGVAIPKLFPFLSCEPSFLIISWVCSHPSTLSFSFERHYSVCFGLQQSDSIFSWNIYHLRYCKIMSMLLSAAYNILLFFLNYTVIFIS